MKMRMIKCITQDLKGNERTFFIHGGGHDVMGHVPCCRYSLITWAKTIKNIQYFIANYKCTSQIASCWTVPTWDLLQLVYASNESARQNLVRMKIGNV